MLDDFASFIAGGVYRVHDFACRGKPVRVGVIGDFAVRDEVLFGNAERIVRAQRAWMDDFSQPFFTVCITPRDGIRAGTSVASSFVCLIDPGVSALRMNILLAHEMFHYWLLDRARVVAADFDADNGASKWAYQWVNEGFTEYFARQILYESGMLTLDELVGFTNEDFVDYWQNPHRHISYAELRKAAEDGWFTSAHQRIGYYRGSLIALDWDTAIRQTSDGAKSLADAIREVIRAAIDRGGQLPAAEFHRILARYGIDSKQAFERHIVRGETPPARADAYAPEFALATRTLYDFAPGFDLSASRRDGRVTGVDPAGHAYAAGLRDGMELVRMDNSRFYDPDEPMRITVRVDGETEVVEYSPKGAPMQVPVYRRSGHDR